MSGTIGERVARIETKVDRLEVELSALKRAVLGPNGENLRTRVHKLENDFAIAASADAVREAVMQGRFSRRERLIALVFVLCTIVGTITAVATLVVLLT